MSRTRKPLLAGAALLLRVTILAVDRPVSTGLEWDLTFLLAARADHLEHFPLTTAETTTITTTLIVSHSILLFLETTV